MTAFFNAPTTSGGQNRLAWGLGLTLILLALAFQLHSIQSVRAPVEEDFYRDLGAAHSLLDGLSRADPNLSGEVRWYNPLTPAAVALASTISGIAPVDLYSRGGPLLNLLGPLALLILVARLHSPWAGCFAVLAYLFLGHHHLPSYKYATYSPWLWPFNFAQGLALSSLLVLLEAVRRNRMDVYVLSGLLLGVTFLAHTAPAALLALTMTLLCGLQVLHGRWTWRQAGCRLLAVGIPSFLVSLVLLLPLFLAYRFHTLNPAPAQFTALFKNEVVEMLLDWKNLLAIPALLGLYGITLVRRDGNDAMRLYVAFASATGLLFLYGLGVDILRGKGWLNLPLLVPSFHFHLYLTLCLYIGFGIAVAALLARLPAGSVAGRLAAPGLLVVILTLNGNGYSQNHDTRHFVRESERLAARTELRELYLWCLAHSAPDSVFLADDEYGQYAIGAAGRKLLLLDPIFTSPYVDIDQRARDRLALYEALHQGDTRRFRQLADQYHITYVLTGPNFRFGLYTETSVDTRQVAASELVPVQDFGPVQLYRRLTD